MIIPTIHQMKLATSPPPSANPIHKPIISSQIVCIQMHIIMQMIVRVHYQTFLLQLVYPGFHEFL
jgi:hypothetical protein